MFLLINDLFITWTKKIQEDEPEPVAKIDLSQILNKNKFLKKLKKKFKKFKSLSNIRKIQHFLINVEKGMKEKPIISNLIIFA